MGTHDAHKLTLIKLGADARLTFESTCKTRMTLFSDVRFIMQVNN